MLNYEKLQSRVTRVMAKVKQGTVVLVRETDVLVDPNIPWGEETRTSVEYELDATVSSVNQKYINDESILVTDKQVTFAVPPIEPEIATDHMVIDGVRYRISDIRRIPEAGTPVAYIAFVRV